MSNNKFTGPVIEDITKDGVVFLKCQAYGNNPSQAGMGDAPCTQFQASKNLRGFGWCPHIEFAIKNGEDEPGETDPAEDDILEVVLFTKPALRVFVQTVREGSLLGVHLVWVPSEDRPVHPRVALNSGGNRAMVGYVGLDQGRWEMRRLVIEHLALLVLEPGAFLAGCQSNYHPEGTATFERPDRMWTNSGAPTKELLCDMYSMLVHSECWQCRFDNGVPDP